jgi:hypothetical protein
VLERVGKRLLAGGDGIRRESGSGEQARPHLADVVVEGDDENIPSAHLDVLVPLLRGSHPGSLPPDANDRLLLMTTGCEVGEAHPFGLVL